MLFPRLAARIDRGRPARFHDTQLGRIGPGSEPGGQGTDMLVEVRARRDARATCRDDEARLAGRLGIPRDLRHAPDALLAGVAN